MALAVALVAGLYVWLAPPPGSRPARAEEKAARPGRPLPRFEARDLDGTYMSTDVLSGPEKPQHCVPHRLSTRVPIPFWVANPPNVGPQLEAVEDNAARLCHRSPHGLDVFLKAVEGSLDENRVVNWHADRDLVLGSARGRARRYRLPETLVRQLRGGLHVG